ncbi:MAG: hypothetical protein ACJ75N_01340 [Actinomycetes bacterium]|jgi:hypothetical protein
MDAPPRGGAVRQVRLGAGELHRIAAFWAAVTGGTVERAGVLGRMAVASRPGRVTLTVEVDDLAARLRWLRPRS